MDRIILEKVRNALDRANVVQVHQLGEKRGTRDVGVRSGGTVACQQACVCGERARLEQSGLLEYQPSKQVTDAACAGARELRRGRKVGGGRVGAWLRTAAVNGDLHRRHLAVLRVVAGECCRAVAVSSGGLRP